MFKDEVYEELDDLSKLVEPYHSQINEELSQFPDEIEITQETMIKSYSSNWGWTSLRISDIVDSKARELGLEKLKSESYNISRQFFKFEARDLKEGEEVTIDFETNKMSHRVFLVKTKIGYDDIELEKQAKSKIIRTLKSKLSSARNVNKSRLNEIADIYGAYEVRKDRSYKGKVLKFCKHLETLMEDKALDIKDIDLCDRFANWIVQYVRDGNLPALNNVTRIKIMMHEKRPIYSIQERSTKWIIKKN